MQEQQELSDDRRWLSHLPYTIKHDLISLLAYSQAKLHQPLSLLTNILRDWEQAGLHRSTAFRTYLNTVSATAVIEIGRLSQHDWEGVKRCLRLALAIS